MFRRKEEGLKDEGFTDSHHDNQASVIAGGVNGAGLQSATASSNASAGQSQTPASPFSSSAPVIPSTQPIRTMADVTRNASAGASSSAPVANASYRPSPVTEFNRSVSRAGQDARGSSVHPLGGAHEKSPVKSSPRILTVGNDILLKGEIATCDRVVIEGRVEAKLSDVHTVEIAASGSFKGTAEVEDAEVSGLFEGDLVVKNRLVIYATGEVRGNITYGEVEVERGGRLMGQIKTVSTHPTGSTNEKPNLLDVLDAKSRSGKDRDHKDAVA